jgi:hypothetical protein
MDSSIGPEASDPSDPVSDPLGNAAGVPADGSSNPISSVRSRHSKGSQRDDVSSSTGSWFTPRWLAGASFHSEGGGCSRRADDGGSSLARRGNLLRQWREPVRRGSLASGTKRRAIDRTHTGCAQCFEECLEERLQLRAEQSGSRAGPRPNPPRATQMHFPGQLIRSGSTTRPSVVEGRGIEETGR